MGMGSLFNNIFGTLLGEAIVWGLTAAGVTTYLRKKGSEWLIPTVWGLGVFVLVLLGFGAVRVISVGPSFGQTTVTTSNVESNVKNWLERFGYSIQKLPSSDDKFFAYVATNVGNGRKTQITRLKQSPRDAYLILANSVTLGTEDAERLKKLTDRQRGLFNLDLAAQMATQKMVFTAYGVPVSQIEVDRGVPISGLSEYNFIDAMDNMDSSQLVLLAFIPRELLTLTTSASGAH